MTTTVHLLRHGEVYNPDRVLYGRLPGFRLSDLGIAQAKVAAEFLAQRPIGYLVVVAAAARAGDGRAARRRRPGCRSRPTSG